MAQTRRQFLHHLSFGAAAATAAPALRAAEFLSKPVSFVVPFAPGGPTDAMARILANELRSALGQTVIVENKGGAGGNIGAEFVARAEADGNTLLFGTSGPLAINQYLYARTGYDPITSFAPVVEVGCLPNVLAVNASKPIRDLRDLVAKAKAKPGTFTFASSGNGASSHLAGVMFNRAAGTDITHVPYKGTGPALTDLLAGTVDMSFTDVLTAQPHVKAGKLRALGVTTLQRSAALPGVPTLAEQGLAGFDVSVFFGVVAPAGTPAAVVQRLNAAFAQVLGRPAVRDGLAAQGVEVARDHSSAQLASYMRSESAKWKEVVKASGARAD
jgi:tripartite-type tricarboxylate transporter receptor subunit TctC